MKNVIGFFEIYLPYIIFSFAAAFILQIDQTFVNMAIFAVVFIALIYLLLAKKHFLLTIFLALTVAFSSEFAHLGIKIGNSSLYVTEILIAFCVLGIAAQFIIKSRYTFTKYPLTKEFMLFYAVMILSLARGMLHYEDKVFVIRQSAMYYYSIFYFLIPLFFTKLEHIETLFKYILAAIVLITLGDLLDFTFWGLGGFNYFYSSLALVFVFSYISLVKTKNVNLWKVFIAMELLLVLLSTVRASWFGLLIALAFILSNSDKYEHFRKVFLYVLKYSIYLGLAGFIALAVVKPAKMLEVVDEIYSVLPIPGHVKNESDNNTKWRLIVWKDSIVEVMEQPLFGMGFGKKFIPETIKKMGWGGSWRDDEKGFQDPHNALVSILYRTGLIGLFAFLLIIYNFTIRTLRVLKETADPKIKAYIFALLICMLTVLTTSCFMVILEGPFMGIFMWVSMALIVALENINKGAKIKNA